MSNKCIFLETAFWDAFSECKRSLSLNAEWDDPVALEKESLWRDLYGFICRSDAFIDTPSEVLGRMAANNRFLTHYLKQKTDGHIEMEFLDEPFPNLESNNPLEADFDKKSVYFTSANHIGGAKNHGVLNVCMDNIWEQKEKFKDSGSAVRANERFNWDDMDILHENSNSMVIVDNYLLRPQGRRQEYIIGDDFKILLNRTLPETCCEDYVLSIFYYDEDEDSRIRESHRIQFSQSIDSHLSLTRSHLSIKVELFPTKSIIGSKRKDFHDRTIITNNVWIGSGAGFDNIYYDENVTARASKTTTNHGVYLGFGEENNNWLSSGYNNLIADVKACLNRYNYRTENRILL